MSLQVKGTDKLMRKLNAMEKSGAKRAMRKATRAGTTVLLKAVRRATPVDKGLLKKAQASKVTAGKGNSMSGIVGADVAKLKAGNEADAARPTNIDWLTEFGHTTPDGKFVPPTGTMRRTADETMPAAEAAYVNKLAAEIEAEAMKSS